MTTSLGSILVTPGAAQVRRDLGPVAWVVAEALVSRAAPDAQGSLVATTGIRTLASELGLDKDTVARALARLKAAGLVARAGQAPAGYVIRTVPGLVALDVVERPGKPSSTLVSRPTRGDGVWRPAGGDKATSQAELGAGSRGGSNETPPDQARTSSHRIHATPTDRTPPHQQTLFAPSDIDTDRSAQTQSLTAFSEPATTNTFAASTHSTTTTSSPTDSCHRAMAEGAGPAMPDRKAARKISASSHPTPSSESEAESC